MAKQAKRSTSDPLLPAVERMGAWVRGPATVRRSRIVMDFSRRERYWPAEEAERVVLALAQVRDEQSALAFVERFGLLGQGPMFSGAEYVDGVLAMWPAMLKYVDGPDIPRTVSEPLAEMLDTASRLRVILRVLGDLRKVVDGKDKKDAALDRLRTWGESTFPLHLRYPGGPKSRERDVRFLRDVEFWLAAKLTEGLKGVQVWVTGGGLSNLDLGEFRFAIGMPTSLLHFCFLQLSQMAIGRTTFDQCAECGEMFHVVDGRQRFCSKACGTRARVRRFKHAENERKSSRKGNEV